MLELIDFFQNAPVDSIFDLGVRYLVLVIISNSEINALVFLLHRFK